MNILYIVKSLHCITLWLLRWRKSYFRAPTPAFPRWEAEFHALDLVRWARLRALQQQAEHHHPTPHGCHLLGNLMVLQLLVLNSFWTAQNLLDFGVVLLSWLMKHCNSHWFSKKRGKDCMPKVNINTQDTVPTGTPQMHSGTAGTSQGTCFECPQHNESNLKQQSKSSTLKSRWH